MKTFKKQIEELETEQRSLEEKMNGLMEAATDGKLGEEDGKEHDEMQERCAEIEKDLARLRFHERKAETAKPIDRKAIKDPASGAAARGHEPVTTKQNLPPGTLMARAVISLMKGGNRYMGADLAARHFKDTPQVEMYLRSIIDAGDTTTSGWASQLVPAARQLQDEFLELLRPATLIGRIPGLTSVPFNVAVPIETGAGSFAWVGEGKPTPVSKGTFSNATVRFAKASGIVPITEELARFSSPSAEGVISRSMLKGCVQFLDGQLLSASLAETADHPAGLLKDISPEAPTGTTAEAFNYDLSVLLAAFTSANQDPSMAVLLISATTAMNLSLMRNALGQREFPEMTLKGGSISGIPVIVSETVGDRVILVNASDILFADDGGIEIDISREASIEMDTTPIAGDASPIDGAKLTSFWQNHLVGIRVTRFISWKRARVSAVAWLDNVAYAPTQPSSPA